MKKRIAFALRQRVAEMAQRLRVVVDHEDGHRVRGVARRAGAGLSLAASATGIVKVKRAPRPTPPLSARMRPPWASTRPLQMARPSPLDDVH